MKKIPSRSGLAKVLVASVSAAALTACSSIGYYGHLARGEYGLLAARRPIERVVADPAVAEAVKARLRVAGQARTFASVQLHLPRNASYTQYADLHRPFATWNVFAAAEFSVDAVKRCYLLVGCLDYRGYFEQGRAEAEAARLQAQGLEIWIGGSAAYSTLGWFADPILNTMLRRDDDELAATIFHELAHQVVFVNGDTEFNESFATFVQREGLDQWRRSRGLSPEADQEQARDDAVARLVVDTRERLRNVYASALPVDAKRQRKREEIESLRREYHRLRDAQWHGKGGYDEWIDAPINNAKLLPFGLYHRSVPAFAALFERQGHDWSAFYAAVRQLATLAPPAREQALEDLAQR
jgi:predicted aminopeptidase